MEEERTIHPSMKSVWAAYLVVTAIVLLGFAAYYTWGQDQPPWLPAIPLILFLFPLKAHIKRRLIKLRLHDNHLTIESGFFSHTRRTVDMAKIQDVTVHQSFGQRILGVGDLMLESAGESGGMAIRNIDGPRNIADLIIAGSKRAAIARASTQIQQ